MWMLCRIYLYAIKIILKILKVLIIIIVTLYAVIIFYVLIGSRLNQQILCKNDTFILPIRYMQSYF